MKNKQPNFLLIKLGKKMESKDFFLTQQNEKKRKPNQEKSQPTFDLMLQKRVLREKQTFIFKYSRKKNSVKIKKKKSIYLNFQKKNEFPKILQWRIIKLSI